MKCAWAYYRCSTDQQERSIPDQKKAMLPILQEHGIQIAEAFEDEAVSGVDPVEKRADFARMQSMARSGMHRQQNVSSILCYDISRWGRFRDPLDSIAYMQEFKRIGLPVYFTHDKYVRFAADTRQAANAILAVLGSMEATGYSEERSKLTTRGMRSAAEDGYWVGGVPPYGMVRVLLDADGNPERIMASGERKAIKDRRVVLAPGPVEQVRVVQMIFDLRANSEWGYDLIAKHLNQRSIPPARCERWSGSTILRILKNPCYAGDLAYARRNASKFNDREGRVIWRPESEWVKKVGAWDGIIDRETWEKVQRSFGGRSRRYQGNSRFPLTGIVKCAKCGWSFYGHTVHKKTRSYYYYLHRNNSAMLTGDVVCRSYSLPRDLLEDFVVHEVRKALLESDAEAQVTDFIRRYVEATAGDAGEKLREIDLALEQNAEKEINVRKAMESGVDPAFVIQSLERLQRERTDLEEKRADLKDADRILNLSDDDVASICCSLGDYLADLEEALDAGGPKGRQDVLRSIVDRVIVDRPGNIATVYIRRIPDLSGVTDHVFNILDNGQALLYEYGRENIRLSATAVSLFGRSAESNLIAADCSGKNGRQAEHRGSAES